MKIIDLLNKIANGEEVPKKIKYRDDIYILIDNYCYYCDETNLILSDRLYAEQSRLNDEVEIIEEKKKIPEKINEDIDYIDFNIKLFPTTSSTKFNYKEKVIINKINEIIDYLKSKGE